MKLKIWISLLGFACCFHNTYGATLAQSNFSIDQDGARIAAESFLAHRFPARKAALAQLGSRPAQSTHAVRIIEALTREGGTIGYVAHLEPGGYVLLRADQQAPPIKLYSENGRFEQLPPTFIEIIQQELLEELNTLGQRRESGQLPVPEYALEWSALLHSLEGQESAVKQLFTAAAGTVLTSTLWQQNDPYNYFFPAMASSSGDRAIVGCTATALAQILRYHQKPVRVMSDFTYSDLSGAFVGTYSISDAGMQPYDWAHMPLDLTASSSLVEKQAVGQLMFHAAVALNSDYEFGETSGRDFRVPVALRMHFGYSSGSLLTRRLSNAAEWYDRIVADIDSGLPIYYVLRGSSGHAVVCDGYRNGDEIHLNFGWGGSATAWYNIDAVQGENKWPGHQAVFGIVPQDSPKGAVHFKSETLSVDESQAFVRVYVSRTGGSSGPLSVSYATVDDIANAGTDYVHASGTLNWSDGESQDKFFDVTIIDDDVWESTTETFGVSLSNATDSSLGAPDWVTVNIVNNDAALHVLNLFNTGVNDHREVLPDGTIGDPHYQLVNVPTGSTEVAVRTAAGGWPVTPDGYMGDNGLSTWIGPYNSGVPLGGATGKYVYRTTFDLSGFDPATAKIDGLWSVDDLAVDILLNGVSIGNGAPESANYRRWTPFTIRSGFVSGLNTLDFAVWQTGYGAGTPEVSFTAVRVEMSHTAAPLPGVETYEVTFESLPLDQQSIAVSPNDLSGKGNGLTPFKRTYTAGTILNLMAQPVIGTVSFQKWLKDGVEVSRDALKTISVNADCTITAVYQLGDFNNGSFESGYNNWISMGNLGLATPTDYTPPHGVRVLVFNWGQATPNGVIYQTFGTIPGQVYTLEFDCGIVDFCPCEQQLGVTVEGASLLLNKTVSMLGTLSGSVKWEPQKFTFTADSPWTVLTFKDLSPTGINIDLLLDNVRVTAENRPVITTQPSSLSVNVGETATFSVVASGPAPLAYQWRFNNQPISGATGSTLTIPNAQPANQGNYDVVVSNASGSITSSVATLTVFQGGPFTNGSFELGYAGWTATGNQGIATPTSYSPPHGAKVLVFNWGQNTPNAVLSQSFTTIPGQAYTLKFDCGIVDFHPCEQRLGVTVQGATALLTETVSMLGTFSSSVRWFPQSFAFTADGTTTTLTFKDLSANGLNIDLLLDNVGIEAQPIGPGISTHPSDVTVNVGETATFTVVAFGKPPITYQWFFENQPINGATGSTLTIQNVQLSDQGRYNVAVSSSAGSITSSYGTLHVLEAGAFVNGSFESGYTGWTASGNQGIATPTAYTPPDGAKVLVLNWGQCTPDAVLSQSFTSTPGQAYTLTFDCGIVDFHACDERLGVSVQGASALLNQTVSIPGTQCGLVKWLPQSFTFVADSATTVLTFKDLSTSGINIDLLLDNIRINPDDRPVIISQPSNQTVVAGETATFTVAAAGIGNIYYQWRFNGKIILGANNSTLTINNAQLKDQGSYDVGVSSADHSLLSAAVTLTVIQPGGGFTNGSFESGYAGWTATGNQGIATPTEYTPPDGAKVLVFNWGQATPNAVLSQSFTTIAGQAYTLQFSCGIVDYCPCEQRLEVTAKGIAALLEKSVSLAGTGSGKVKWTQQSFAFTADSTLTTLTFKDLSSSGWNIDLLLDNVQVAAAGSAASIDVARLDLPGRSDTIRVMVSRAGVRNAISIGLPHAGSYQLQRSTDLIEWTIIGTIDVTNPALREIEDSDPPDTMAFYRVLPVVSDPANRSSQSK